MSLLTYHTDPGHGWLEVSLSDFPDAAAFGTGFGYQSRDGRTVYLEEDCEMSAFLEAHPAAEMMIVNKRHRGDAPCRNLPSIGRAWTPFPRDGETRPAVTS